MTPRHIIYTTLAGLHLVLVACGAAGWSVLPERSDAGHGLRLVRNYTGSDAGYGFFAPGVGPELRVTIILIDANGKEWTDTLEGAMNREARLRVGSGISRAFDPQDQDMTKFFSASWAATMFGRHPSAKTVVVRMEVYDPPTMEDYQKGVRAEWKIEYQEVFNRK